MKNGIDPIKMNGEQLEKLRILAGQVAPHFISGIRTRIYTTPHGSSKPIKECHVIDNINIEFYPWLEFCFVYIVPMVARVYVQHHIHCTESWANRMILQKLAHELTEHNPIDTLYTIWEKPDEYAQGL